MAVYDLLIRILARNEAKREIDSTKESIDTLRGAIDSVKNIAKGLGLAFGAAEFIRLTNDAMRMAAVSEDIERAFRNLANSVKLSADAMVAEFDRIAAGTISMSDIMRVANMALQAGNRELAAALPRLFEIARVSAVATGQDVLQVFDALIRGIVRASPLLIDNANIFIRVGDSVERYAQSINKNVEELSVYERQVALLNAVLADSERILTATGLNADSASTKIQSLTVAVRDLKEAWGEVAIEAGIPDLLGGIAKSIREQLRESDFREQLRQMAEDFEKAGMDIQARQARLAASLLLRPGMRPKQDLDWLRDLQYQHEVLIKLTKQLETAVSSTSRAMAQAVTPATQWGDALAYLNMRALQASRSVDEVFDWTRSTRADRYREGLERRRELWDSWLERERLRLEQQENEKAEIARRSADAYLSTWENAFNDMRRIAEQALRFRVEPTELDFILTDLGQYEDAPLEAVRRLNAIIARGFAELQIHPDWASLLKIPESVLTGSELELKAWAMRTKEAVMNLTRPDLIDWDAFIETFRTLREQEALREQTLDIAMQKLAEAGLLRGIPRETAKAQVAAMLGIDTPEDLGAQIAAGFDTVFVVSDPLGRLLQQMEKGFEKQKTRYNELGKAIGQVLGDGIHDAAIAELDMFLPDLAKRISPYLVLPTAEALP